MATRVIPRLPSLLSRTVIQGFGACGRVVNDLLFPWYCVICGREGPALRGPWCESCRAGLLDAAAPAGRSACPRCALPTGPFAIVKKGCAWCRGRSLGFDAALALWPYEASYREICLMLKHEHNAWLAPWLSGLLATTRRTELAGLPRNTWVVPVPLHWWRRLNRGYNQAEALAQGLAGEIGLHVHQPLRRVKATDHLASQKATERLEAMRDAFRVRRSFPLKGRTILLVDDILTTGATSGAAARALKQAGARRVIVAVLARTV